MGTRQQEQEKSQDKKNSITMVLKPVIDSEFKTIFVRITPEDFAMVAGLMYSAIPHAAPGGTLLIESPKDNLFFTFVQNADERVIEHRSLIGE